MLRKVGLVSALLLAIPALASAWTVTAKIGSGEGSVLSAGKTIAKPISAADGISYIGYYKADNVAGSTQAFTITPGSNYSLATVVLNGVNVTDQVSSGVLTVPAGAPIVNSQALVVYFKQNLLTMDITQVTGGKVTLQRLDSADKPVGSLTMSDLTTLKPGSKVRVTAMPNADYKVATFTDLTIDAANTYAGEIKSKDFIVDANKKVDVTFVKVPTARSTFSVNNTYINPGESVTVTASSVSNVTGLTYALTSTATDAVITPVSGKPQFTVQFPTAGVYSLTLTPSVGTAVTKTDLVRVEAHNACTTCHASRNADIVASWKNSTHGPGDAPSCVSCHTAADPHVVKAACVDCHTSATQAIADWSTGAHGLASGHTTGTCQRCHATEGAIAGFAAGFTGGYADVLSNASAKLAWGSVQPIASNPGISCNVCHDPHSTGGLRKVNTYDTANKAAVVWDPNGNGKVDQLDVCTGCHTLIDNTGKLVGNYHDSSSASVERTISDSHFDDPTTVVVEGYNLRKTGATPCADCHNLHKADLTIQEEWAESGHAGKISVAKTDALCSNSLLYYGAAAGAACTDLRPTSTRTYIEDYKRTTTAATNGTVSANALLKTIGPDPLEAFVHYNWTQTTGTGNRATCEKCHTATGAANYMSNPAAYVPANNDFSHIPGWTAAAGANGKELLYCWGCHSDSQTGALRNPGAVVADYKFQGASAVYPNVGPSNTCLTCHVGQASGNSITDLTAAGNTFTNQSFVNSHYMAAGALMYVKGGYTNFVPATTNAGTMSYGQSLTSDADQTVDVNGVATAGKLTSTHRKLGTAAIVGDHGITAEMNLASAGPCATCHYAGGDHTLELGQKAIDAVCSKCHEVTDQTTLDEFLEVEGSAPFEAAINLALTKLSANYNITYNQASYPYFYDQSAGAGAVKNWTRSNFLTTALSAADAEKLMGAAFNINLLQRDPAAYAHARTYARRLLFDTIDFLDDGVMNMSAADTAAASGIKDANGNLVFVKGVDAKDPATTQAYMYLAGYNRTTGAWNAAARP